jgi:hypothetical protein
MSKPEKLKKLAVDIDYIDPVTMTKVCSFNQCIEKFTLNGTDQITTHPKWSEVPITKVTHFHVCNSCGRKHRSKADKSKNVKSFYASITGGNKAELEQK